MVRDTLAISNRQLSQANNKIDNMTIEKLCKDSPILLEKLS